jgi:hypothetical protein
MTLSERFALLKKAATASPKPGQQGVQKQITPKKGKGNNIKGKAQAQGGGAQAGNAGKKKGKKGKGKGKGGKPVDHATLDQQMEMHMAEGGDGGAAAQ